jgi:hypothetical protein
LDGAIQDLPPSPGGMMPMPRRYQWAMRGKRMHFGCRAVSGPRAFERSGRMARGPWPAKAEAVRPSRSSCCC